MNSKCKVIVFTFLLVFSIFMPVGITNYNQIYETRGNDGKWTFMVYMDADNNLESAGIDDFLEMSSAGSNSDLNIIVQFDRISAFSDLYGDWNDTKRFYVTQGMTPTSENASEDLGEMNMGNPQTLIDFVEWGVSTYSTDYYALILWDHGWGIDGFCQDNTDNDQLEIFELKNALSNIISDMSIDKIDVLGFDACTMAMTEIAYEIKDYADYMVGSEEEEPEDGWPYDNILSSIISNPIISPIELSTVIVEEYYYSYTDSQPNPLDEEAITQSSIDLTALSDVKYNLNIFSQMLLDVTVEYYSSIQTVKSQTESYGVPSDFIDLYHFTELIIESIPELENSGSDLLNSIDSVITSETHGTSNLDSHGLSIFFPSSYDASYDSYSLSNETYWNEFLKLYLEGCIFVDDDSVFGIGTIEYPFKTIQNAINNADNGDIIRVFEGIYYENIVVDKEVTIIGNSSDNSIIDGGGSGDVVSIVSNNVLISGFSIINSGTTGTPIFDAGVDIRSSQVIITNNNISGNSVGIYAYQSSNDIITYNTISNNSDIGTFMNSGCNNNTIENNKICYNQEEGIYFKSMSDDNSMFYNYLIENEIGIRLEDSSSNTLANNNFTNNVNYGIFLEYSNGNLIHLNRFINNNLDYKQVLDNGSNNNWYYDYRGNWWSDWTSPDDNEDGIVDYSYSICGSAGSIDGYPLTDVDNIPPEMIGLTVIPELRSEEGFVNISVNVTDGYGVYSVWINIDGIGNYSMNCLNETYYYNASYSKGIYNFIILANDINGNWNTRNGNFEIDITQPQITNVQVNPNSQYVGEYVNISANVADNICVEGVWLYIGGIGNFSMIYDNTTGLCYLNSTYSDVGIYSFSITAVDSNHNWKIYTGNFEIIANQSSNNTTQPPQNSESYDFYLFSTLFLVIIAIIFSVIVFIRKSKTSQSKVMVYECPECGAEINENDQFCPQCGIEFEE